jgi:predicted MFS family arabinose efflux permease
VSTAAASTDDRRRSGRASRVPPIREALRNHDLVRVLAAFALSSISEWALWIGVLVYAHERGGAAAAGTVSIALVLPATLAAPLAGSLADGSHPNRVLVIVYATQTAFLIVGASIAGQSLPLYAVVIPIAVATTAITFVRPTLSVVVPGLVASPAELTAGNLLGGYCDAGAVLIGPALAGAILAVSGPAVVLWTCAVLSAVSSIATVPLLRLDVAPRVESSAPTLRRITVLRQGFAEIARRRELRALMVVLAGQYVLIGGLDLIYIVFAVDELHLSASAPGLFGAAFGVGALIGGVAATVFVSRPRLANWTIASLVLTVAALLALAGVPTFVIALCLFPLMGLSRSILDLTGRILLQRAAPQESLATTFAVLEAMSLLCSALGVFLVQILVAASGARAALVGIGCLLGVLLLVASRHLRRVDDLADAPVVAIRLLRRIALFAPLPGPALEGVARAGRAEHCPAGSAIVTEGEPGDRYYAIARGDVAISVDGRPIRTMTSGQGFGEIALLADRPRTATARAVTDVEVLTIGRAAFLTAILGHDASTRAAWRVATALEPSLGDRGE